MVISIVERRIHHRASVAATAIVWIEEQPPVRYLVEDLSAGGALLTGGPSLPMGQTIGLSLHIPSQPPMVIDGSVVRSSQSGSVALAVAFRSLSPADEDAIHQAVLSALEAQNRGECPSRVVLVIDDSEIICETLRRDLSTLGHEVVCARTPTEANTRIHDPYAHFDIAIVDLFVGELDGVELLGQVAGYHPGVHRVLMSSRVAPDQLKLAKVMGKADVILPKPWTRRALISAMPR
ncbi:MAG TPA: response regulator [Polyangiaceae bacterium]